MELLDDLAEQRLTALGFPLPAAALAAEPDALRRRILRLVALAAGSPPAELFHEHVLALDALVTDWHGQRWVDLPGHLRGVRRDGAVSIEPAQG
jgi:tRNA(Ile)-lysidine synthase